MMKIVLCFMVVFISGAISFGIDSNPFSDEFIDYINSQKSTWTAGRNFDKNTPVSHIRRLLGTLKSSEDQSDRIISHSEDSPIPESFDSREKWSNCKYIGFIRDQSACASSWAVAAASAMSDRICIHSNGEKQIYVSDQDLIACVEIVGEGCTGGFPIDAWSSWQQTGVVSGGPYNSTMGCMPYSLPPCEHYTAGSRPKCPSNLYPTPECLGVCTNKSLDYATDQTFGNAWYRVLQEKQIQLEILKNGPVETTFDVYEDFPSYKSGVYQYVAGKYLGRQAVRILGWGVENGTPYWLIANSWNEDWGDKGLFKIFRGRNECFFEEDIVAALPNFDE